jgi:hypothetical protein
MRTTLLTALIAVAAFTGIVAASFILSSPDDILRAWLPQFLLEFGVSLAATVYIWRLAWRRDETSWLLAMLSTCALLITLGLLPATLLILAELSEFEVLGSDHPVLGIGILMLYTGIVVPLIGGTLWWHRNRG